ncbi:hypothetical protein J4444_03870 [Candidatus Woesearchaeota archaeon]|nr:hypothetical protein [Candidatus Woesearchaeota archaeon]
MNTTEIDGFQRLPRRDEKGAINSFNAVDRTIVSEIGLQTAYLSLGVSLRDQELVGQSIHHGREVLKQYFPHFDALLSLGQAHALRYALSNSEKERRRAMHYYEAAERSVFHRPDFSVDFLISQIRVLREGLL